MNQENTVVPEAKGENTKEGVTNNGTTFREDGDLREKQNKQQRDSEQLLRKQSIRVKAQVDSEEFETQGRLLF